MTYTRARTVAIVLWQIILLVAVLAVGSLRAQQPDTMKPDSLHRVAFTPVTETPEIPMPGRTIDLALTGGAGYNQVGLSTPFQATANADFFARTQSLDFTAGFHWGFSNPATQALSLGLRFPIAEKPDYSGGIYGDAGILFFDNGGDIDSIWPGLRGAIAWRSLPIEARAAVEFRRFPFEGTQFNFWGGIELGFVINLIREGTSELTLKDTLRAELKYIATTAELEELDRLQSNAEIGAWLDRFWRARNVTGNTPNEAREEYERRIRIANEKYGSPRTLGVTTDMGRVLLIYGEPDRVESAYAVRYVNHGGSAFPESDPDVSYVLWIDENRIRGHRTAFFLFVRDVGTSARGEYNTHGEYREVYSNIAGEPSDGLPTDLPSSMKSYIEGFR